MAAFQLQKERCLSQVDLSKKGSVDDKIVELIQFINNQENFFTTSSCSGRISVFSELADQKKRHCEWLYVSHDTTREEDLLNSFSGCQGDATFKFEPFVLHVQCKDLHTGQQMLKAALVSGYKNSGIVLGKKGNVIVGVRSTQNLEVPIIHKGELMVSEKYITFLVMLANEKLEENQNRINRFFKTLKDTLDKESKNGDEIRRESGHKGTSHADDSDHTVSWDFTDDSSWQHQIESESEGNHTHEDDFIDCLSSFYDQIS